MGNKAILTGVVVSTVIVLAVILNSHAVVPNISVPDYQICQNPNTSFTITVYATGLSNVNGWQFNLTWASNHLNYTGSSYGSPWTGGTGANSINYAGGRALIAYAFNNGASYTNTGTVALATVTFKILHKPMVSLIHITTSAEHTQLGTLLYDPNINSQTYTTTDGSVANCVEGPSP